jgi:hypothetical protein
VHSLFNTVGQCINRVMKQIFLLHSSLGECFLWGPLTHRSRRREGLARPLKTEEPVCHCSTVLWRRDTQHRPYGQGNAWYRLVGSIIGWQLFGVGRWTGQVRMPNNKQKQMSKKLHSYPLGHESRHEGRREISGRRSARRSIMMGRKRGSIVPFGLQKR